MKIFILGGKCVLFNHIEQKKKMFFSTFENFKLKKKAKGNISEL